MELTSVFERNIHGAGHGIHHHAACTTFKVCSFPWTPPIYRLYRVNAHVYWDVCNGCKCIKELSIVLNHTPHIILSIFLSNFLSPTYSGSPPHCTQSHSSFYSIWNEVTYQRWERWQAVLSVSRWDFHQYLQCRLLAYIGYMHMCICDVYMCKGGASMKWALHHT